MRLSDIVAACDKPFQWGQNDCCTLLGVAVQARQGRDIVSAFLPYDSRDGAAQALRQHGKGTLLATLTDLLGDPIPVARAQPGDIVMSDNLRVGVCLGRYSAFIGEAGIETWRTLDCRRAFENRSVHG